MSAPQEPSPSAPSHRRRNSPETTDNGSPRHSTHANGNGHTHPSKREQVTAKLHLHRHTTHETGSDTSPRRSMEKGYVAKRRHKHTRSQHHNIKDGLHAALGEQFQDISDTQNARANHQHHRRRHNHSGQVPDQDAAAAAATATANATPTHGEAVIRAQRPATERDVEREKWRQGLRDAELLSSLHRLSARSLSSTRQLDDIYYSILEKLTALRSTVASMQELAGLTRDLHADFEAEAGENARETKGQVDALGGFEAQEKTVEELERRIKEGRERAVKVGERLGVCRETLAWIEKRDAEETAKAGRFYRGMWMVLGVVVAALCLLKVAYNVKIGGKGEAGWTASSLASSSSSPSAEGGLLGAMREELGSLTDGEWRRRLVGKTEGVRGAPLEEDYPRLRIFDEL